ncbi:MAG: hypothetical protein FWE67_06965 [Planctomycetaceae bacterium]|nr:hypothetical protein [Planctomycetaceae bacterium]
MKTTHFTFCGLTVVLLLGLTTLVSAQNAEAQRKARENQRAMMRSPAMKRVRENSIKLDYLFNWDNRIGSATFGLLYVDGNAEALGISEEQRQKIVDAHTKKTLNSEDPELKPILNEMRRMRTEMPGGPFAENASEETQKKFFDLQMEMNNVIQKRRDKLINETLSPEQFRKIQEYLISTMANNPFVSPDMFEALDLSDEQKRQLADIKRELKPEYEKQVDKLVEGQLFFQEKFQEEIGDKLDNVTDPEERKRISTEASKKVVEKYPEYAKGMGEFTEAGNVLANNLKFKMFDVLTDEQIERMKNLIDNPPEHVKKIFENFRKMAMKDNAPVTANASGEWRPGPDSWKPGDAIPEEYLKEREKRRAFPKKDD